MRNSDFDMTGGQQFTLRVTKSPEGFSVSVPSAKELGSFAASTQSGAIQKANDALNKFVANNYQVKK